MLPVRLLKSSCGTLPAHILVAIVTFLSACADAPSTGPLPNPGVPTELASAPAPDSLQGPPGPSSVGPVSVGDSYSSLVQEVGATNVRDTAYPAGEGTTRPGVTLYPGTPEALTVFFEDPSDQTAVAEVIVAHPRAPYLVNGLRLGMTLEEAQAVNGQAFSLAGLTWDYGGRTRDWGVDGRVSNNVTAVFEPRTRRAVPPAAQGDTALQSDSEVWRGLGMWLVELRVGLTDR